MAEPHATTAQALEMTSKSFAELPKIGWVTPEMEERFKRLRACADPHHRQAEIDAVAEALVSFEKQSTVDAYYRERDRHVGLSDPACTGHYEGFQAEAEELIKRIEARGYVLIASFMPRQSG